MEQYSAIRKHSMVLLRFVSQRQKDLLHYRDIKKQTRKQNFPNGNRKGELVRTGRNHITTGDIGGIGPGQGSGHWDNGRGKLTLW